MKNEPFGSPKSFYVVRLLLVVPDFDYTFISSSISDINCSHCEPDLCQHDQGARNSSERILVRLCTMAGLLISGGGRTLPPAQARVLSLKLADARRRLLELVLLCTQFLPQLG